MADLQITRFRIFQVLVLVLILNGGVEAIWLENADCDSYSDVIATDPVGFQYHPVYVHLNRCKGASLGGVHHRMSCQPDPNVMEDVEIQVLDVIQMMPITLHMRNETKCVYKCIKDASVCTENEVWVEDTCECECRYHRDDPPPHCEDGEHWEYSVCACVKDFRHPGLQYNGTSVEQFGYHAGRGAVRTDEGKKVISIIIKDTPKVP